MNKNVVKILIPVVALLVIVESVVLLSKYSPAPTVIPTEQTPASVQNVSLSWNVNTKDLKTGITNEIPLMITSDKDVSVDAIDLYVNYDSSMVTVNDAVAGKGFVVPSFKKVNGEKGMVVMNFLVSEADGFKLKKGESVEIARLNVNYKNEGKVEFAIGEGTLVVENGTAKVLPFNSDKLVINVSR